VRQPTIYLPHGGGPCFFMEWTMGPRDTWDRMKAWLTAMPSTLPERPRALLVVSAHWEERVPTVLIDAQHGLLYDYSGFPAHTYQLKWPAPGDPALAERVVRALGVAGIPCAGARGRGLDHGVFIPLMLGIPAADIPTVQLSLWAGLDPSHHLAMGRALAPLRDEGVLIVGSGMSYHNMSGLFQGSGGPASRRFDEWLTSTVESPRSTRETLLNRWTTAPAARACHPREEHLLPLMVVAGAAGDDVGSVVFRDEVMGAVVSAARFG
jgi:aromatic ring-opening dioxygenase catalytic subunit (LigB family)